MLHKSKEALSLQRLTKTGQTLAKSMGLVVQLVRISACHAEGRGFESRPDRQKPVN